MKKTMRYLLFGGAAILSLFFMTACGKKTTPGEEAIDEMTDALEEITSVRMSLAVDWTPVGEAAIALKTDIEQMKEPMDYHTVLTVTQGKGSASQELYVINQRKDLACSYVKERNKWAMYEHDPVEEDLAREILLTAGSDWQVGEEKEENGILCVVLTGEITTKNMAEVLKASGVSVNVIQSNAKGVVTLYQDKETKLPVSVTIDCGTFENTESFLIQCVYYGFNDLDAIVVPDEVKNAASF